MRKIHCFNLLIVALLLPMMVKAQVEVYCPSGIITQEDEVLQARSKTNDLHFFHNRKAEIWRNPSDNVKVSFNFILDPEQFSVEQIFLLNVNGRVWVDDNDYSAFVFPETYDIIASFRKGQSPIKHIVILENVEIAKDTIIDVNAEMATNHIKIISHRPDGELLLHGKGHMDEDSNEWIVDDKGDIERTCASTFVICKEVGVGLDFYSFIIGEMGNEDDRKLSFLDFYINDVSNRYLLVQIRNSISVNKDVFFVSYFSTDNVHVDKIENDPNDFYYSEETFEISPDGKYYKGGGWGCPVLLQYGPWKICAPHPNVFFTDEKEDDVISSKAYLNIPAEDSYDNNLKLWVSSSVADHIKSIVTDWGDEMVEEKLMCGPLFSIKDEKKYYLPISNRDGFPSTGPFTIETIKKHLGFLYLSEAKTSYYGSTCPINNVIVQNLSFPWSEEVQSSWVTNYIGRYGETRFCDDASTTLSMKFNGEIIENPAKWFPERNGVYDIKIENTNIIIDGLPGKSTTLLHYDLTKEENTPPTIQMLMFKDEIGHVTEKFSTGAEGVMEFSAAVFDYDIDIFYDDEGTPVSANYFYYYNPLNVLVEYSPYDAEEWKKLDIKEVPELNYEKGWGYFYRASLKDVEGEGEKGWFDVRFTMSDEAGNTHVQTVSPAFRLDDRSIVGVANVEVNNVKATLHYGLDGKRVDEAHKGVHIVKFSNGEVRKMVVK